jgi:hypothetical protein
MGHEEKLIIRLLVDVDDMTFTMRNKLIVTAIVFSLFLATYVAAQENNLGSQKAYAQTGLIRQDLNQIKQILQSEKGLVQQVKTVIMNVVRNQKGTR